MTYPGTHGVCTVNNVLFLNTGICKALLYIVMKWVPIKWCSGKGTKAMLSGLWKFKGKLS